MRDIQHFRNILSRGAGGLVLAAAVCWAGAASADRFPPDPVEELRQTLKAPVRDAAIRDRTLEKQLQALHTLGEMRRALLLQEWRDETDFDESVQRVDQKHRGELVKRFEAQVREVLRRGDISGQLAVVQSLGEQILGQIGTSPRGDRIRNSIAVIFGPDLAELTKTAAPRVRAEAARALGKMNARPEVAVPALGDLLGSDDPGLRLAAVEGLTNLVTAPQAMTRSLSEVMSVGRAVVPLAGRGLRDGNPEVRRQSAETLYQAAASLARQVPEPRTRDELGAPAIDPKDVADTRKDLLPLIEALQDLTPTLARALSDPDPVVRLGTARALEELSNTRVRLQLYAASVLPPPSARRLDGPVPGERLQERLVLAVADPPAPAPGDEALLQALRGTLPGLRAAVADPDARVRLAALEALESFGPEARPAAPEVIRALCDPSHIIRWAAARTLGKAGPVEEATAVPALTRLLFDADLDLRLAAATALERFGPAAKEALPALVRALGASDAEMRLAAMDALRGIGTEAAPAIRPLSAALADPDPRVRRAAAELIAQFGPVAREAESSLRGALNDSNPDVRQAASDALLSILR
jgi:HEAT repeat protein